MKKFNEKWMSEPCEKCGCNTPENIDMSPTISYEKYNTTERNNLERLRVICKYCGYNYFMEVVNA